jgi:3-oxoacyl-[acyl-carrier-protein] synthase-3
MRNALILVGDTPSKVIGKQQFSTRVLFGDGGTATLLSKGKGQLRIQLGSNGAGFEDIIIKNGLMRYPSGNKELEMSGINVFSFGISKVPKAISSFLSSVQTTPSDFTYIILHQANKMMLERIMKKINFLDSQSLYSLELYGNTGNASIPVTICHNLKGKIDNDIRILCAGFGTGLSWSIFDFVLSPEVFLDLIEYT